MQAANQTCFTLGHSGCRCPCSEWSGPRITSLNDTDVRGFVRSGIISKPSALGRLSLLSAGIHHLTAWQLIADTQERGPTLIVSDDDVVRAEAAERLIGLLTNASAFQPPFDLLYLNAALPNAVHDRAVIAPERALSIPRLEYKPGALAIGLHGSAYALHAAGAVRLLELLRADRPDLSMVSLYSWVASKLLAGSSNATAATSRGLRAFAWDRGGELIERRSKLGASSGGFLHHIWHAFTHMPSKMKHPEI